MKRKFTYLLAASLLLVLFATAQTTKFSKEFPTSYGKNGITKKVSELPKDIPKKQLDANVVKPLLSYFHKNQRFTLPKGIVKGLPLPPQGDEEDGGEDLTQPGSTASIANNSSGVAQQIHS